MVLRRKDSAGAHLVSLLAANPAFAAKYGAQKWLGSISLDTAAYDIEDIMSSSPSRLYRRAFGDNPSLWRAASPMAQLTTGTRPILLICSTQRANACLASKTFAAAVMRKGGQALVVPINKSHNELNKQLGKSSAYTQAIDSFLNSIGLP